MLWKPSRLLLVLLIGICVVRADEVADWKAALAQTPTGAHRVDLLINLTAGLASNAPAEAARFGEEAVRLAQASGDRPSLAQALLNLGLARFRQGEYEASRIAEERARALFRELGDRPQEASAVLNLGNLSMVRSAWPEAIARYEESLALGDGKTPPAEAAKAYANLSGCWLYQGDLAKAEEHQQRALGLRRSVGDRAGEAESLLNLGVIAFQRGDYAGAIEHYTDSLRLAEALGELRSVAAAAGGLATIFVDQRRLDDAVRYLDQCIAISRQTSDLPRLGLSLATLSSVRQKQARYPEARQAAEEAAKLGAELQDARLLGVAQANLGDILIDEGRARDAVPVLQAAVETVTKAGDPTLVTMARVRLAKAYRLAGQPEAALRATGESVAAAEASKNKRSLLAALDEQANARETLGDSAGALRDARRARLLELELIDESTARKIADAQTRYETEKKTRQIEVLERDRQIRETQSRLETERTGRQIEVLQRDQLLRRQERNSALAGAALLLALAVVASLAYRVKRRAAAALEEKNERLGEANRVINIERAKSDKLLLSILPASIAAQLKDHAGTIADSHPHATVLFADLVNFTAFSQTVRPEELVRLLDQIFTRFDRLALKYGVEKIKSIGDCYMVVSGLPEPDARHCENIARLALEMLPELHAFNAAEGLNMQLRIGFHSGPVVAGIIGRQKFIYDLWGDTVNTASRMESSGVPGRIQLSELAARELHGAFECELRGEIEIRGKGRLSTYFLNRALATS